MKSDIEIWYEKKLKEGISKEVLLGALRQQNYSESQIDNLSHKMDQYINEMSNIKHNLDNINEDSILNRKLQIEADLTKLVSKYVKSRL